MDQSEIGCTSGSPFGADSEDGRCNCGRPLDMVEVQVTPTTGGQFPLKVAASDSVEYLRKLISKRLRVPKERICLLYRERHLREGTLGENSIMDGARITLLPSVETGLLTQRPEQSVMQALESLNDGQVNDFLSGKAPLNLTMRLGDHMMLIQLQLSTVSPSNNKRSSGKGSSSSHLHDHHHHVRQSHSSGQHSANCPNHNQSSWSCGASRSCCSPVSNFSSISQPPLDRNSLASPPHSHSTFSSSNLGSPERTTPPHHHYRHNSHHHFHRHNHNSSPSSVSSYPSSPSSTSGSPRNSPFSMDTETIRGCPHQDTDPDPTASLDTKALAEASRNLTQTLKQLSNEVLTTKPIEKETVQNMNTAEKRKTPPEKVSPPITASKPLGSTAGVTINSCSTSSSSATSSARAAKRQGAIIESMHHHGKGVYSGTFSGTLNPALQDRQGRPKRDISTIIHILNDLLCATPQYRRHSASKLATSNALRTNTKSKHDYSHSRHSVKQPRKSPEKDHHMEDNSDSSMDDSQVTRCKLEQLKYIMEQRRVLRKARREARATPYSNSPVNSSTSTSTTRWSSETTTLVTSSQDSTEDATKDCDLKPAVVA